MKVWLLLLIVTVILAGDTTRNSHSPCRILINEVSFTKPYFLEISKICPVSSAGNDHVGLAGYGLVIIEPSTLTLKFHKALDRVKLSPISASDVSKQAENSSPPSPALPQIHSGKGTGIIQAMESDGNGHKGSKGGKSSSSYSEVPSVTSSKGGKSSSFYSQVPSVTVLLSQTRDGQGTLTTKGSSNVGLKESKHASSSQLLDALAPSTLAVQNANVIAQNRMEISESPPLSSKAVKSPSEASLSIGPLPPAVGEKSVPRTTASATASPTSVKPQSPLPNAPNTPAEKAKGDKRSAPPPSSSGNQCSSVPDCPNDPKKPRRTKREAQFMQTNVWAIKDIDLGGVSLDESQTYVVALIYLPTGKRTSLWDRYRVGSKLTDEVQKELKQYTADLLIISGTSETDFTDLLKILPQEADLTYIEPAIELDSYSFSKCDKSLSPFNPHGFMHSEQTRGRPNICLVNEEPSPFSFRGTNLKIQSQKFIVNVVTNLRKRMADESWRRLNAVEAAASILNLSPSTVYRVMGKYDNGVQFTEGKKQCRPRPVTNLEPKWQNLLYRAITWQYEKNLVPRVAVVLKEFVQAVRTQQLQDLEKQQATSANPTEQTTASQRNLATPDDKHQQRGAGMDLDEERPAPELYHCSARSFTKILDRYGYKYGKIRNRDAQIFRPVNLKWREMYLAAIDKYDADPEWNVVYLDETYIDPHQRASRGIVLKKYENFQQRKDFTFKDDKISRGSRLIILAAGGFDGFIHEATDIYAVSVNAKKKRTDQDSGCSSSGLEQDYHDNVKGPKFMEWLEKLFKLLENKKTVFVMDNCPFHKVLGIPKTSDRKDVIRQWLEEKKVEGYDITEDVGPETKLTKMALLGIVGRLTTDDASVETKIPRTQVQQLARKYGHRVLLLPPYNCDLNPIEEVWNDIKREVKEKNTEQTVSAAKDLANRAISVYTKEQWQAHIRHTKKLRDEYREGDKVFLRMESTLDNDEAAAAELSDADYTVIDKEGGIDNEEDEECVYEEIE